MTRRTWGAGLLVAATLCGAPSVASADQLFGVFAGGFFPYGFDSRTGGDVLVENLLPPVDPFVYDISDFKGFTVGGEYLIGFGDWIEAGVGVSGYSKTVDSFYRDSVHPDRTDILQDIKMSIVGAGINIYKWKYSESGEFIDYSDESIFPLPTFRDTFEDDGVTVGPMFLGGVRAPIGENLMLGGEFRWQGGSGDLDPIHNFTGDKLDLGGFSVGATFHVRF
jgi:hypothetical protein